MTNVYIQVRIYKMVRKNANDEDILSCCIEEKHGHKYTKILI